nr:hypothetical protein GCM10020063_033420 [Dactylosporangium thailandense]
MCGARGGCAGFGAVAATVDGVEDAADRHVDVWARELENFDLVAEAIFARLAILARYQTQLRRDVLAEGGLQHWQFKVLLMLRRNGPPYTASPSQLADLLGLTRGALSARLAAIEDAGWIVREADARDRRRVHVRLTDAGDDTLMRHIGGEGRGERILLAE